MELKIEYSNKSLKNEEIDLLVLFVAEDADILENGLREIPIKLKEQLKNILKLRIFNGKMDTNQHLVTGYSKIPQLFLFGIGKKSDLNSESIRSIVGKLGKILTTLKADRVGVFVSSIIKTASEIEIGQVLVEGLSLGAYEFKLYKNQKNKKSKEKSIKIKYLDPENLTSLKELKIGKIRADGTNLARNLGNIPSNDLRPKDLSEVGAQG